LFYGYAKESATFIDLSTLRPSIATQIPAVYDEHWSAY